VGTTPELNAPLQGWVCLYRLDLDKEFVAQVQEASRTRPKFGFPVEPALFGSREWWRLIDEGRTPSHWLVGEIIDVSWGSMADWPVFTLRTADGSEHNLTREGDVRRYVIGIGARIHIAELERKPTQVAKLGGENRATRVLEIYVEDDPRRSPAIFSGPSGAGYELAGSPAIFVHYFWVPNRPDAERLMAGLDDAARSRSWRRVMGGTGCSITLAPDDTAQLDRLLATTSDLGGRYEGYDVIPSDSSNAQARAIGPSE
jgi:hypothetical protein